MSGGCGGTVSDYATSPELARNEDSCRSVSVLADAASYVDFISR